MGSLKGKKILVIDNDPETLRLVEFSFSGAEARVFKASTGQEGLRQFYAKQPDLVILDITMPKMDGWEVCRRIHQISSIPIIILTELGGEENIVRGLDCGAVDYVTKPFSPKVLVARAQAALRWPGIASGRPEPPSYCDNYLTIDLKAHRVLVCGKPVKLTTTEYTLLSYLFLNAGQVLTFRQILEHVWGMGYQDSINYVHVYMSHLRNKLEEDPKNPRYLLTEHGVGYRFRQPPSAGVGERQDASLTSGNSNRATR